MTMYERIKELRQKKGYSQQKLADLAGYHDRSSIAKIESGFVDLPQSKILQFAKVLGVSPAQLMGLEEEYRADMQQDFWSASDDDKLYIWEHYGGTPEMADEIIQVKQRKGMSVVIDPDVPPMQLTSHEREVVLAYRDLQPEGRRVIDNALGIAPEAAPELKWAARGKRVPQDGPVDEQEAEQAFREAPPGKLPDGM